MEGENIFLNKRSLGCTKEGGEQWDWSVTRVRVVTEKPSIMNNFVIHV